MSNRRPVYVVIRQQSTDGVIVAVTRNPVLAQLAAVSDSQARNGALTSKTGWDIPDRDRWTAHAADRGQFGVYYAIEQWDVG